MLSCRYVDCASNKMTRLLISEIFISEISQEDMQEITGALTSFDIHIFNKMVYLVTVRAKLKNTYRFTVRMKR